MSNKPAPNKLPKVPLPRDDGEDDAPQPVKLAAPPYLRPNSHVERNTPSNASAMPQCWNCKFFIPLPDRSRIDDGETPPEKIQGQCRGKPPVPMVVYVAPVDKDGNPVEGPPEPRFDSYFPIVRGDLWCGDWGPYPTVAATMRH